MEYRRFGDKIIVRIDKGEEIHQQLKLVSLKEDVALADVSAIGAISALRTGIFDTLNKEYIRHVREGMFEIVSLSGTITTLEGEYYPHLHICVSDLKGAVFGGHLDYGVVSATCEAVIQVMEGEVNRKFSSEIGINLMDFR